MVTTAGAETLPFLAAFVVLPASLTFFVAYGRMVEHLPHNLVFYASIAPLVRPAHEFRQKLYAVGIDQGSGFWTVPGTVKQHCVIGLNGTHASAP